ncbi:MAG: ANTAR domain-containing response regulator [Rhodospirillales bacterium]
MDLKPQTLGPMSREGSSPPGDAMTMRSNDNSSAYNFANLSVAVVTERDDDGGRLIRELQRLRARVQHLWPMPQQLPMDYDVVFCDLTEDLPSRLPWLPGEPKSALVLIVSDRAPFSLGLLHRCAAQAVLHYPVLPLAVQTTLALSRDHHLYERRLRGRIEKLDDNLRNMRSVERAKSIVMHSKGLDEEEAYHFLRRQAMARRVSIGEIAKAIIDSQELLG